jgi:hypothetical protein
MSTCNMLSAVYKSTAIANDVYKYGHVGNSTTYSRSQGQVFRRKAKSPETVKREDLERRHEARSNICSTCHEARSLGTGECAC